MDGESGWMLMHVAAFSLRSALLSGRMRTHTVMGSPLVRLERDDEDDQDGGEVPDDVADAVRRAIAAIESAWPSGAPDNGDFTPLGRPVVPEE